MTRITLLAIFSALLAFGAGCGGEEQCAINSYGQKLCGDDARTYCEVIDGLNSDVAMTRATCEEFRTDEQKELDKSIDSVNKALIGADDTDSDSTDDDGCAKGFDRINNDPNKSCGVDEDGK